MNINDINLNPLIPEFMRKDVSSNAIAEAVGKFIASRGIVAMTSCFANCDLLDDAKADQLAEYLGIFYYRNDWPLSQKIECIRNSELIRLNSGSKYALQEILRLYFGDPELIIEEAKDYNPTTPYQFRIFSNKAIEQEKDFVAILDRAKRSVMALGGVFVGFSMQLPLYRQVALFDDIRRNSGFVNSFICIPANSDIGYGNLRARLQVLNSVGATAVENYLSDKVNASQTKATKDISLYFVLDEISGVGCLPRVATDALYRRFMQSLTDSEAFWKVAFPSMAFKFAFVMEDAPIPESTLLNGLVAFMEGGSLYDSARETDWVSNRGFVANYPSGKVGLGIAPGKNGTLSSNNRAGEIDGPNTIANLGENYSELTLACWLQMTETAKGGARAMAIRTATADNRCIGIDWYRYGTQAASQISFWPFGATNANKLSATIPAVTGTWIHFCATLKENVAKIYVNGNFQVSKTWSSLPVAIDSDNIRIGPAIDANECYDELGVWNRCLSEDEIRNLYNAGVNGVSYPFGGY